jgi:hypothetical protein
MPAKRHKPHPYGSPVTQPSLKPGFPKPLTPEQRAKVAPMPLIDPAALALSRREAKATKGGGALPAEGEYGRIEIVHADVDNPTWEPGHPDHLRKVTAAINSRRDVLEWEFGRKQISPAAYLQGRIIQQALEIRGGSGQAQWSEGDRVDAGSLVALAIAKNLDRANAATHVIRHCLRELGRLQGGRLVACLRQPATWETIAQAWGLSGRQAQQQIAWQFRQGLEHLAKNPP